MSLLEKLTAYGKSDYYPFHMPGHKRKVEDGVLPYGIDITEIDGFDDLHHADGILKEAQDQAAKLYGAGESHFLVNGSTSGNLAALFAAGKFDGKILMARNSHRSAYHGALLLHAKLVYLEPPILEHGIYGSVDPEEVRRILEEEPEISVVFLTSPTYEGVVSDIAKIAEIVHAHGAYLIVDEAHGAHFSLAKGFPKSAVRLGADLVIQSLHKTLPCMTQTAILHNNAPELSGKLAFYLRVFQTSSPSYVLMSSIEEGLRMAAEGEARFAAQLKQIRELSDNLSENAEDENKAQTAKTRIKKENRQVVTLWNPGNTVFARDPSKLILLADAKILTGHELQGILREKYHLETEMAGAEYVIAMTSMMDSPEGFERLQKAVLEINQAAAEGRSAMVTPNPGENFDRSFAGAVYDDLSRPQKVMEIFEAFDGRKQAIALEDSVGRISAEFVYIYPPGTPILVPGERITGESIDRILTYAGMGLSVQGLEDTKLKRIWVCD